VPGGRRLPATPLDRSVGGWRVAHLIEEECGVTHLFFSHEHLDHFSPS
jgi:hypothetical protein